MSHNKIFLQLFALFALFLSLPLLATADSVTGQLHDEQPQVIQLEKEQQSGEQGSASVIQSFATDQSAKSELVAIEDKTKRLIMFLMGVPLLILIFATAALGVAMGVYGKPVFVPHMICAGFSLTLALGHAVVGIVWFYPF